MHFGRGEESSQILGPLSKRVISFLVQMVQTLQVFFGDNRVILLRLHGVSAESPAPDIGSYVIHAVGFVVDGGIEKELVIMTIIILRHLAVGLMNSDKVVVVRFTVGYDLERFAKESVVRSFGMAIFCLRRQRT